VRLDEVVLHALEKEPSLRYQQASQVKTALETIAKGEGRATGAEEQNAGSDPDTLEQCVMARDYALDIGSCIRRGWALVRSDFWPILGVTALVVVLIGAASSYGEVSQSIGGLHKSTSLLSVLLGGPLMGGLYFFLLQKLRGQRVRVETAFAGFKESLLHLFLAGFVTEVLTLLGLLCLVLPGIYLFVAWFFALPLVIDKRLEFWPAMRISRRVITKHWWNFLGFLITLLLFNLAGALACLIGLAFTLPTSFAALMYAYEDIINGPGLPPSEAPQLASVPPSAAPARA